MSLLPIGKLGKLANGDNYEVSVDFWDWCRTNKASWPPLNSKALLFTDREQFLRKYKVRLVEFQGISKETAEIREVYSKNLPARLFPLEEYRKSWFLVQFI